MGGMNIKRIIFGSLLTCFLIMAMPNISAVEYLSVVDEKESAIEKFIDFNQHIMDKFLDKIMTLGSGSKKSIHIHIIMRTGFQCIENNR
jgi:hypothetical protein